MMHLIRKIMPALNLLTVIGALPLIATGLWYLPVFVEAANALPSTDYIDGKFNAQRLVDNQQRKDIDQNWEYSRENRKKIGANTDRYWDLRDSVNKLCFNTPTKCLAKDAIWYPSVGGPPLIAQLVYAKTFGSPNPEPAPKPEHSDRRAVLPKYRLVGLMRGSA